MIVERPASVYDGFPQIAPLVYHFGHVSIQQNPKLYDTIVDQMAELVHERMESNKKGKLSCIILYQLRAICLLILISMLHVNSEVIGSHY